MGRGLVLLLLVLVGGATAAAEEKPDPTPLEQEAAKALTAFEAKDHATLKAIAANEALDVWLVANELCVGGAFDAAEALAKAAPSRDLARLPDYITVRRKRPAHEEAQAAARAASHATDMQALRAALPALEEQRGKGDRFERALIEYWRALFYERIARYGSRDAAEKNAHFGTSVDAYMNSGELAEAIGWLGMARLSFDMAGNLGLQMRRFSLTLRAGESLRRVQEARGSVGGEARAALMVGAACAEMGDYDRAARHMLESVRIYGGAKDAAGHAEALLNLALLHNRRGEYARAQTAAERGLEQARAAKDGSLIARAKAMMGDVLHALRDYGGALAIHKEAYELFVQEGDELEAADSMGNIAVALQKLRRFDEAAAYLRKASAIYDKRKSVRSLAIAMMTAGSILLDNGELGRSLIYLNDALRNARFLHDPVIEAATLSYRAQVKTRLRQYDEARADAREVIRLATELAAKPLLFEAYEVLAEIAFSAKDYGRAVSEAHRALGHSTSMLMGLDQETGSAARGLLARLYLIATWSAAAWGRPPELFDFLESGRAGALLESLEGRQEIRAAAIPEALRVDEDEAKNVVRKAQASYQSAYARGNLKTMRRARAKLEAAHDSLDAVVDRIQRKAKAAASVLYPEALSLDDFQGELQAGDVFVAYGLLPRDLVALVVTAAEARLVLIPGRAEIEKAMDLELDDPDSDPAAGIDTLAKRLVKPLALPKGTRRLLVSPAGALGYVPFALLTDIPEVVCVPSGTAYGTFREQAGHRGRGVLALGDPNYAGSAGGGFATLRGRKLTPLPESRIEAKKVGDVQLLGLEATKARLMKALETRKRWRAVHLACHGVVDAEHPMRSALALAPETEDNGLLSYSDVFRMSVPADLVVLSACETGKGKVFRAEGIVGMTQAFMLAGAPRVICSLWKVDDEATQALMVKFYELWNPKDGTKGLGAAAALRKAQAFIKGRETWKHPYYWAAWVLWGLPD